MIEKSLFKFIWAYSKRQQIVLLIATVALFPFLFLTLELPKRIINDAIGASADVIVVAGYEMSQVGYLGVLCGAFLIAVFLHGLLKMRINTMKGVLAERMLRRLRYTLVTQLFRFPKPYFQRTSQAEVVSMITSEAEPLGGMMGDAISQPIMQMGQMLTILVFLFLQSFWFGVAAVSMIPLQAWLIPKLQKQINILNKKRIKELRTLAGQIGETAVGSTALRTSGGYWFRAAQLTHQLGELFTIRLSIYKKKFFMKFLNNFLGQLTPFFFFAIGGYLVIIGNVTIGALVAALAAYKDLSSPWKELLTYYTQAHEMAQRWTILIDNFAPTGALDQSLIAQKSLTLLRLNEAINFESVSAHDSDGIAVVTHLTTSFPAGGYIGIAARKEEDRRAVAELLTRELQPDEGLMSIGQTRLDSIHQDILGARIGWSDSSPYIFAGTIRDNILMSLRTDPTPKSSGEDSTKALRFEAKSSGNSMDLVQDQWISPALAGLNTLSDVYVWLTKIIETIDVDQDFITRTLTLRISGATNLKLSQAIVERRDQIKSGLAALNLDQTFRPFDPNIYNPEVTLLRNILFAAPKAPLAQSELAENSEFLPLLKEANLVSDVFAIGTALVDTLFSTFGNDGTDHPLFQRMNIGVESYNQILKANENAKKNGISRLSHNELSALLALPCIIDPVHITKLVPKEVQEKVIAFRTNSDASRTIYLDNYFHPLKCDAYNDGLSILENAIYGVIESKSGTQHDVLQKAVIEIVSSDGTKAELAGLMLTEETAFGGSNLSRKMVELIGLVRAAIKRPDILVLDKVLSGYDANKRTQAIERLREEMPETTFVLIDESFSHPEEFDVYIELEKGRAKIGFQDDFERDDIGENDETDLITKLRILEQTEFFADLDRKQMRLLAFSASWFEKSAGETIFRKNDEPHDGAYLITDGQADFVLPTEDGSIRHIRTLGQGALVGELALILGEPRSLTMIAKTDLVGLRIGGTEFVAVLQNDPQTAFKMLQSVTRYLSKVSGS